MLVPGKLALAVVAGGIALGALLGNAANPVMKKSAGQPWQSALPAPVYVHAGYRFVEAGPEDLSPYPDSYAPTWANEALAGWEPEYPAWSYGDFDSDWEQGEPADQQPLDIESEAPAPPEALPQAVEALSPEPQVAGDLAALY